MPTANWLPHFLAVLNTDSDPQGLIRHGNERVLRARFNDARFFWETDQKKSLLERLESLKHVTFQKDLGSYFDKTQRVQRLCSWLSEILKQIGDAGAAGSDSQGGVPVEDGPDHRIGEGIHRAAGNRRRACTRGCSNWIPRLPEATRFAIADAIYDHYKPESTDDDVPRSIEGACFRSATRPTRLPECLRWAWCRADRRIHLRCAGRRTQL